MRTRLIVAAAMVLGAAPVVVAAASAAQSSAPAAQSVDDCTPTLSVRKPELEASGHVTFAADFSVCETTRIKVKYKERGTTNGWLNGHATYPGGSTNSVFAGECLPDGQVHKWVAYATMKLAGAATEGPFLQTAKVYFKATPVTSCGTWDPL